MNRIQRYLYIIALILLNNNIRAQKLSIKEEEFIFEEGKYFNQCHASTIEESIDGNLLISWFGGTHEGSNDVSIWGSIYDGVNWSTPNIWASGSFDEIDYPCWNPVLFRPKNSKEIYLYYKVGPNPREWWSMFKISYDNGNSWSEAKVLPKGYLGPIKNKPIELNDNSIIFPSSIELSEDRWLVHLEKTNKEHNEWFFINIDSSSVYNVIQPSLVIHPNGNFQVLCRSKEGKVMSSISHDQGQSWSSLTPTNLINPNSATDAIRFQDRLLIVYNPDIPGKDWWDGRAKLELAESVDGIEWKEILSLEDHSKGEFSYPTIFLDSKGIIHITYTYNRKNIKHIKMKL